MNHTIQNLQISLHKLDGSVSAFVQDDLEISKRILDEFQPMQIFCQSKIVLADRDSHTAFPVSQLTRIDFECAEQAHLILEKGVVEAVELSRTEFETLIQNLTLRDQWNHLGELDASVVTFLNVEMADGNCVLLTMEVDAESPQGLGELRDYLMNRPALCFRMRSGGVAVLNLANLTRMTFFPGTVQPSPDAWHVRLLDAKERTSSPDNAVASLSSGRPALSLSPRETQPSEGFSRRSH